MSLRWELRDREALSAAEREAMYALLAANFVGPERGVFARDLAEKHRVILLWDDAGALRGFSTLRVDVEPDAAVLFSGDTIVDPAAWGSPALAQAWLRAALDAAEAHPDRPLDWLLIASGFRTYRFLPLFFREHWPRHDQPTPAEVRARMDRLARARFGPRFHDGVVSPEGAAPVRPEVGAPAERHRASPAVRFFERINPGHVAGDELVCLARVTPENFTPAALRVLRGLG